MTGKQQRPLPTTMLKRRRHPPSLRKESGARRNLQIKGYPRENNEKHANPANRSHFNERELFPLPF
jgi:hypothetical protein